MPSTRSAVPRSPDLVRKLCSSQNPYRLICSCIEPASFQSRVTCSTLNIAAPYANFCRLPLHRVVPPAKFTGVEKNAHNLHVVLGHSSGRDNADHEQRDATHK